MRLLFAFCVAFGLFSSFASAQENLPSTPAAVVLTPELVDAYRDYALARQQLIEYRQVTLPMKRQALADVSAQTRLELAVLNRRLGDYRPFLRVGDYSPVRTAAENDFLTRNLTAQQLKQLQEADLALMRYSGEADELYQYDVLRAAVQVYAARAAQGQ
jgi:hypothetical protein